MTFDWFPYIRMFYLEGYYVTEQLDAFVRVGWITQEQLDGLIAEKEALEKEQEEAEKEEE